MTDREKAVVAACADTVFPPGGPIPYSGTDAGLVAYVAAYMTRFSWSERLLVRLLLVFIQLSPLVFGPRFARFTRLSPADRTRMMEAMCGSPIYFRFLALSTFKLILTMGYFAYPPVSAIVRHEDEGTVPS